MTDTTQQSSGQDCSFAVRSGTAGTLRLEVGNRATAERLGARLRKTLMRDSEGAAVSAVRIRGVEHEFQSLPGVQEDVLTILDRLRTVNVALRACREREVTVNAVGPGTITAGDLVDDDAVTVGDPTRVIATLNTGATLEFTARLSSGAISRPPSSQGTLPGWLPVDGDISPVDRVSLDIEECGGSSRLTLHVVTKGALGPAEAVAQAAVRLGAAADTDQSLATICQSIRAAASNPAHAPVSAPAVRTPLTRELAKTTANAPIPDLAGLQKRSFEAFMQLSSAADHRADQGLDALLREAFSHASADATRLEYDRYEVAAPARPPAACQRLGTTYSGELRIRVRKTGGEPFEVKVADLPLMTDHGTFIISGVETLVVGQLQALEDTRFNDLATRRLLLVGHQLDDALAAPLAEDLGALELAGDLAFPHVARAVRSFFAAGRFVRRAETTNPLTLVSHLRSVVQHGVERRPGYDARCVHPTHFGRLCVLETPEGERIGINLNTAVLADLDDDGRLLTPYLRDEAHEPELLPPEAEADKVIGDGADDEAYRKRYGGGVLARRGSDIVRVAPETVEYRPVHPAQALGVSASLIPFAAHDDANRALMGTNMQKQAVALLQPQAPFVQTGLEAQVAADARAVVRAETEGVVVASTAGEIAVRLPDGSTQLYALRGFAGSSHGTSLRQRPLVSPGAGVRAGQVIADGPATDNGVLALGRNVLVGYMLWEGYNFEDGLVISDRLTRDGVFTSLKVREFSATVSAQSAGKAERIRTDHLPSETCANVSEHGVVREGAHVRGGAVLVAKAEDGAPPCDTSLRLPAGQSGIVVRVERYSAGRGDAFEAGVGELVRVTVVTKRVLKVGDKLCNRHGAKGVAARIVPEDEMPVLPDGRVLDVILNPLGVPSRMNIGSILETHLGLAAHGLQCTMVTPAFGGASVADIESLLSEAGLPASGMFRLRDGRTGRCFDHETTVGYQYMMKLTHMVDDRRQERSTGPYSADTQQPVGGRRYGGGQHVGIMETWALQAHGAAHILQELLTVKSDDVEARELTYDALASATTLPEPTVPYSVKRLTAQLRGLCIELTLVDSKGEDIDVFGGSGSVNAAVSATIGFASPDTVLGWSAGEIEDCALSSGPGRALSGGDGLTPGHITLAAPVKHAWRELVPDCGAGVPDLSVLPVLPRSLRGGARLDRLVHAVARANAVCRENGADVNTLSGLQAAVDELLNALTRLLYGKRGWITAALSGKTVDYSGRSVVCPGPELRYDTCSLPRLMAATLFEPVVAGRLIRAGLAQSVAEARRMLGEEQPSAMEVLRQVAEDRLVILHRAPVLHRMGMQAFRARIADEDVIRIHPLTNVAFNADFDGDEMDVFLPLSAAAQDEAQRAVRASRCQVGPANGMVITTPSQDMVFGCYYATCRGPGASQAARGFDALDSVAAAFENGSVGVHDTITVGERTTTVGRVLFNQLLPQALEWVDKPVSKTVLRQLLTECWHQLGPDAAAQFGDAVMRFGFHQGTLSGLSLGKDILKQYSEYDDCLAAAWRQADELEREQQAAGAADPDQARWAVLDHWTKVAEAMTQSALVELAADRDGLNPLHLMLTSSARGSRLQLRQLVAMRGLMARPDRQIMSTPFTLSFIRGHSPLEYFASTFGARRGLADTALKTAEVGFLFKRIMSAAQDVVLSELDCGAAGGVVKVARQDGGNEWFPLRERIVGRTASADIVLPGADEPLVRTGQSIGIADALAIDAAAVPEVSVRSPLTCDAETGVCATCYGLDLATWQTPALNLAVGVLAAQSIGEPATQLTMRTFALAVPSQGRSGDKSARADILGGLPRLEQLLEAWPRRGDADTDERREVYELYEQHGAAAAGEYLLTELQRVYRAQGVRIDDRHFEVVLRQMLRDGVRGLTDVARRADDFIAAGSSHGGVPALARAVLRNQCIQLNTIRSCTAFGKLVPSPDAAG